MITGRVLAAKFEAIFPHLDERQRRLLMGAEARALGHGGIRLVARAAGVREATVSLGVAELEARAPGRWAGRAGPAGGASGRPTWIRGCARRCWPWWSRRSAAIRCRRCGGPPSRPRTLAGELTRQGHRAGADTVADLLREEGFSLQGNAKTIEGQQHPDRDAQFRYINEQVRAHRTPPIR